MLVKACQWNLYYVNFFLLFKNYTISVHCRRNRKIKRIRKEKKIVFTDSPILQRYFQGVWCVFFSEYIFSNDGIVSPIVFSNYFKKKNLTTCGYLFILINVYLHCIFTSRSAFPYMDIMCLFNQSLSVVSNFFVL